MILTHHQSPGNILHMIEEIGVASSEREQMILRSWKKAQRVQSQSQGIIILAVILRLDMFYLQQIV